MSEMKTIPGNENYSATTDGQIIGRDGTPKSLRKQRDGYLKVGIYKDGKKITKQVHRLIAETFIPNPDHKPCVNHRNGNKEDNSVDNLEWCTYSENSRHAIDTGLQTIRCGVDHPMYGRENPNAALKARIKVRISETGEEFDSVKECADAINGNSRHITDCLHGRRKTHMGYHFEAV